VVVAVRAMSFEEAPYLPLRLVEEQLDTLEGLWLRRPALVFDKRLDPSHVRKLDQRIDALLRGLALRREASIREAALRMASPLRSECFASTRAFLYLSGVSAVDSGGCLAIRPRCEGVIAQAARDVPREIALRLSPGHPIALEALGRHELLEPATLLPHLEATSPSVLFALRAARHLTSSDAVLAACLKLAFGKPQPHQPVGAVAHALFVLGLACAKSVERDAFPALVDTVLGDAIFDRPYAVRVMAVFGNAVTARRVGARALAAPTAELGFCLGMLGVAEQAAVLAGMVERGPEPLGLEAMRALHTMSGVWPARSISGALRDDGRGVQPNGAVARALAEGLAQERRTRRHLGVELERSPAASAPATLHWLHGITTGDARSALEVPDGLLEPRSRPRALWELGPPQEEADAR